MVCDITTENITPTTNSEKTLSLRQPGALALAKAYVLLGNRAVFKHSAQGPEDLSTTFSLSSESHLFASILERNKGCCYCKCKFFRK